jgi:tyrosyl-tRNA synthetase
MVSNGAPEVNESGAFMSIFKDLEWRGLVQDVSDREGIEKLSPGDAFYVGFDPTAPSLQVGNLVCMMVSIHLTKAGLKPILLFGGATGTIGDPGGRNSERVLMDLDQVEENLTLQQKQMALLWERSGSSVAPTFVNNFDWTKDLSLLSFLRDVGKYITVNYMVAKEVVKTRLEGEGISYTEFSYMLLQAADFLHLFQVHGCKLQIGGSDQWGNLTAGLELIRKKIQKQAYAFSFPLITDSQGKKFGKSAGNAIWLDPKLTSPYKFHQFWLNTPDDDVVKLLKVFTFESQDSISELERSVREEPQARRAQRHLADSLCTLVHGVEATEDARKCAEAFFGGSLDGLTTTQLLDLFSDMPSSEFGRDELSDMDILTLLSKTLAKSKGEARRLFEGGGVYIDNQRAADSAVKVSATKLFETGVLVLRSGKKNYHLVKVAA